jgi:hypothetical protein
MSSLLRKRITLWAALSLVAIASTGCFLRLLLGVEVVTTIGDEVTEIIDAVHTNVSTAICRFEAPFGFDCTYVVQSDEFPYLPDQTSTFELISEFGILGVLIDPLVLELPATVTEIAGTYTDGGANSGDLVIYPNLSYVPADDTRTLTPGPGKQLVIVDLPQGVPLDGVDYEMSLSFRQLLPSDPGPTPVRALLTGRVPAGGKTYYPPILPCTSDVSSVPLITLPRSSTFEPPVLSGDLVTCDQERYFFLRSTNPCDLDNDHDVDRRDLDLILAMRNRSASPGDPRDMTRDGRIDVNDARRCTLQCYRPRCSP